MIRFLTGFSVCSSRGSFQWVLVAVGPVDLGDSNQTEDILVSLLNSRPDGQSAESHEQYRD